MSKGRPGLGLRPQKIRTKGTERKRGMKEKARREMRNGVEGREGNGIPHAFSFLGFGRSAMLMPQMQLFSHPIISRLF